MLQNWNFIQIVVKSITNINFVKIKALLGFVVL